MRTPSPSPASPVVLGARSLTRPSSLLAEIKEILKKQSEKAAKVAGETKEEAKSAATK